MNSPKDWHIFVQKHGKGCAKINEFPVTYET